MSFQPRAEIDQLQAAVDSGGNPVLTQVLTGIGGVGKTQLAADYARTAWSGGEVDVLVWISASSRSAIMAGYAQAGVEVLGADPRDPEQAARAYLAWLEPKAGQTPCRWLIIFDDVTDPADMGGWWPPTSPVGRVLVTTRRREAALTGVGRRLVTVGLFTPQESAAYLSAVLAAHSCHEPTEQINSLAADLGHLPLALAQAASYIIDTDLTCASYRQLLTDRIRKLADLLPEPGVLPDGQAATLAATWSLSVERANQLRPMGLARPMLHLAAFLDPNGIPVTVLTSQPALAYAADHRTAADTGRTHQPFSVSAEDAVLALKVLRRLSLIDYTPAAPHRTVRVHQLIQRATSDDLTPDQYHRVARTAADALAAAWPPVEKDSNLSQALRANALALTHAAEDSLHRSNAHPVLFRTGESLGSAGQFTAAATHYQGLAITTSYHLGLDHPDTLAARGNLAHWQGAAGDAAGAVAGYEELLPNLVRVQGLDHPDTLAARGNLAHWQGVAGDAAGAVAGYEELLPNLVRVQGLDHPDTLAARGNLAHWRGEAGDAAGAATEYTKLLDDLFRALGPDHLHIVAARGNLAHWRGEAGDAAGAAAAFAELLADRERLLGPDHLHTLAARGNLAHWRGEAGDAAGAAAAFAELLADRERLLGPDHLHTLAARSNLAHWRGEADNASRNTAAFKVPQAGRMWVLKSNRSMIARGYLKRYDPDEWHEVSRVDMFKRSLAAQSRDRGPDHPYTLAAHRRFADARGEEGDAAGAAAEYTNLLGALVRVLGSGHPDTLAARYDLAHWRGEAGDAAGAAAAFEELLAARERFLGPDHPDTLSARGNVAHWRGEAGDAAGAAAAFEKLLADRERLLGPDHPDTLHTYRNVVYWRDKAGSGRG
ncbi:tetratricopeptide repeat protein [Streptomyces sp. 372A]